MSSACRSMTRGGRSCLRQGKSTAMSALPTLQQRGPSSVDTLARPAEGLRDGPDPSPAAPAPDGRRFNALWIGPWPTSASRG
jgi:hypothetical protein